MEIDFNQLVFALSETIDLVGVDELHHGKRVGYMAWECAKAMGGNHRSQKKIFQTGLLHDCGVSSTRVHASLVNEMDWEGSDEHCKIGAKRLKDFPHLANIAEVIYYHHTHWTDLNRFHLPEAVWRPANLIYLLDRADSLAVNHRNDDILDVKDDIRHQIRQHRNTMFHPDLVDLFLTVSEPESFWLTLEPRHLSRFLNEREKEREPVVLSMRELKKMAVVFAQIVDAKSPYTAEHSMGVALVAKCLAGLSGLPADTCNKIEIAGLLHDLGKLKVPDEILENKGRLDMKDLAYMRHHSFETFLILSRIEGMEDIALWAANHHESLDGFGYPFHRAQNDLGIESRIISVADVFQALAQSRPYRAALPPGEILIILKELAVSGRLDPDLVSLVAQNLNDCYQAAMMGI